jgi:NTP pyrophosphatase (non-canonical NTP hydrolase)
MNETELEHQHTVTALAKPGQDVVNGLNARSAHLLHMAVGVAGEAGELLDAVKKHAIYGADLDIENVIEELGDLEFYLQGIRQELKLSRSAVLAENIRKLKIRYGTHYSNEAASARKDKA